MQRIRVLLALVAAASLAGCGAPSDGPDPTAGPDTDEEAGPESLLYVLTAANGTLTPGSGAAGSYVLSLTAPSERVVFFSDRPQRDTGTMSLGGLLEAIFGPGMPSPNAALVADVAGAPERVTLALELSEPSLGTDALTFTAVPLEEPSDGLAHLELDDADAIPSDFTAADLFIDSGNYHKCYAQIENDSPYIFNLTLKDPDDDDRWANIPQTIGTYTTKTATFRFHSNSEEKAGKLDYAANDPGAHELSVRVRCQYSDSSLHAGVSTEGTCVTADNSPFKCRDSGASETHTFKVSV